MEKSMRSSVSALLPAWQSAGFIQATLDCLSAQTYSNFQVIVSVDLCEDDTYSVCMAHAQKDSRFQVIKQNQRLGYVGNCNFLLDRAKADYVIFAFHDDILAPEYIASLVEVLDERPEVVLSYSDLLLTNVDGQQSHEEFRGLEGAKDRFERGVRMLKPVRNWWVPNRGLFRLENARQINGLKRHAAGEFSTDWPWLVHMSLLGEFARIPKTLCYKYYMKDSLSRNWGGTLYQRYAVRAACMREVWNSAFSTEEKVKLTVFFPFYWVTRQIAHATIGRLKKRVRRILR
ncbi:MAG: glycosyltransferase family 2 protein [Gammaproteobacteria bacterium]